MLVGVDAPLGVAVRDMPKRLKKPNDLEEIEETALVGVDRLEYTCCAAMLSSEPWRDDALEAVGVS